MADQQKKPLRPSTDENPLHDMMEKLREQINTPLPPMELPMKDQADAKKPSPSDEDKQTDADNRRFTAQISRKLIHFHSPSPSSRKNTAQTKPRGKEQIETVASVLESDQSGQESVDTHPENAQFAEQTAETPFANRRDCAIPPEISDVKIEIKPVPIENSEEKAEEPEICASAPRAEDQKPDISAPALHAEDKKPEDAQTAQETKDSVPSPSPVSTPTGKPATDAAIRMARRAQRMQAPFLVSNRMTEKDTPTAPRATIDTESPSAASESVPQPSVVGHPSPQPVRTESSDIPVTEQEPLTPDASLSDADRQETPTGFGDSVHRAWDSVRVKLRALVERLKTPRDLPDAADGDPSASRETDTGAADGLPDAPADEISVTAGATTTESSSHELLDLIGCEPTQTAPQAVPQEMPDATMRNDIATLVEQVFLSHLQTVGASHPTAPDADADSGQIRPFGVNTNFDNPRFIQDAGELNDDDVRLMLSFGYRDEVSRLLGEEELEKREQSRLLAAGNAPDKPAGNEDNDNDNNKDKDNNEEKTESGESTVSIPESGETAPDSAEPDGDTIEDTLPEDSADAVEESNPPQDAENSLPDAESVSAPAPSGETPTIKKQNPFRKIAARMKSFYQRERDRQPEGFVMRLSLLLFFTVAAFLADHAALFPWLPFAQRGAVYATFGGTVTVLMAVLLTFADFREGMIGLLFYRPKRQSAAALTVLLCLFYDLLLLFFPSLRIGIAFHFPTAAYLTVTELGSHADRKRKKLTRAVSDPGNGSFYALQKMPDLPAERFPNRRRGERFAFGKKAQPVFRLRRVRTLTDVTDKSDRWSVSLFPPRGQIFYFCALGILGLLIGILSRVSGGEAGAGVAIFALCIYFGLPLSSCFSLPLLYGRGARRLSRAGVAVLDPEAIGLCDGEKTVLFDDTEMLCAHIKSTIFTAREPSAEELRYEETMVAQLFSAIGGTLGQLFPKKPGGDSNREQPLVEVSAIHPDGIEAYLNSSLHVLVGSASFINRFGIRVPLNNREMEKRRQGVFHTQDLYLAFDGKLHLGYEVEYALIDDFEKTVQALEAEKSHAAIRTYDPCLTKDFVGKLRGITRSAVYVQKPKRFEYTREPILAGCDAIVGNRQCDAVTPIALCRRWKQARRDCRWLSVASSFLALCGMAALALTGASLSVLPVCVVIFHFLLILTSRFDPGD